jgi:hypothetical protein
MNDPPPAVAPVIPPVIVPTVHVKLAGALDVREMLVAVPLQISAVGALVTTGVGFTVTVIEYGVPVQPPVVDVGVTIYSTLPADELPGFVNVWLMVDPDPALAPEILPLIAPIVHVNVLGALEVSARFVLLPLQIDKEDALVTTGLGLTVTTIEYGAPGQVPVADVGVTIYSTEPELVLPGLVSTWLIVDPDPALAPVIPPLIAPIVHV